MKDFKNNIKNYLVRPLFEQFGIDKLSRPSLNNLDTKLEEYLDFNDGIFLEIGANDGFKQSNTYYFERLRNWRGVLIEPIPFLYEKCKKIRKRSEVFNCICSLPRDSGGKKKIRYAGLMSQVRGVMKNSKEENERIDKGIKLQKLKKSFEVEIECRTLSEIIEKSSFKNFDFMSIDVEGFELQVLKGLDLKKYAPRYLLIEMWSHEEEEVNRLLSPYYNLENCLSTKDMLFKRK